MGGISSGSMGWDNSEECAIFHGNIRTENNGGFSSIRTNCALGLSNFTGIYLDVKCLQNNKSFAITLKDSLCQSTRINFKGMFSTSTDWVRVRVSFQEFVPELYGRRVTRESLMKDQIIEIGLLIIKQAENGPFALKLKEIGVY